MKQRTAPFVLGLTFVGLISYFAFSHDDQATQDNHRVSLDRLSLEEHQQMVNTVQGYLAGTSSEEQLLSAQRLLELNPELTTTVERKQANTNSELPLISRDEFERMAAIIQQVNEGILPTSALQEAQTLVKRNPHYVHAHVTD